MTLRSRRYIVNSLFVGLLMLYMLAGVMLVPFHGDESATIHKAHDWFLLTRGDIQSLLNSPSPVDPAEKELRLINGVISGYSTGLLAMTMGLPEQEIPQQWLWGADWNYNLNNGHIPSIKMLLVGRLSSAFLTLISIALIFAFAQRLQGMWTARLATFIYATMPSVLLNGRRAMYEGATLLAVALMLTAGLGIAYWINQSYRTLSDRKLVRSWLLFGVASGFAMACKHILVIIIVPVGLALLIQSRHTILKSLGYLALASIVAITVFFLLNPAWWNGPVQAASEVIRLRREVAQGQLAFYGGYTNLQERLIALINTPLDTPQYYESTQGWPEWIGDQIKLYERSGLNGIIWSMGGIVSLILRLLLLLLLLHVKWPNKAYALIFWCAFLFTLIAIFILTPFPWQRYYLPLAGLWAIVYAIAVKTGLQTLWRKYVR